MAERMFAEGCMDQEIMETVPSFCFRLMIVVAGKYGNWRRRNEFV
jgi:hypothetical protein